MDIEKFKKESEVTYVYVKGDLRGVAIPKPLEEYDHDSRKFETYMEVPFTFDEFMSFSKDQQIAICEAELIKIGKCVKLTICNPDRFYN